MVLSFLAQLCVVVLTMLVIVPLLTRGNVSVPSGSFLHGLAATIFIGVMNWLLWKGLLIMTLGLTFVVNFLTFGLVALLVNSLAIYFTASLAPKLLYVKSFGFAVVAALITTVAVYAVHVLLT